MDTRQITLQSTANTSLYGSSYTLTGGVVYNSNINGLMAQLEVTEDDLNEIKRITDLFTCQNNLFISVTADLITDMRYNRLVPVSSNSALPATDPICDDNRPRLRFFYLDMDSEQITLSFSETMNVRSINFKSIVLQAMSDTTGVSMKSYRLNGGFISTQNSSIVILNFLLNDLNNIKSLRIAESNYTSWLVMDATAIQDMSGHQVVPLVDGVSAHIADTYLPDITHPIFLSFRLDMDTGIVVLTFLETVNPATLDPSTIALQPEMNVTSPDIPVYISDLYGITAEYSTVISIQLSTLDLNTLKLRTDLATSSSNTFIALTADSISDMQYNPLVPVGNEQAEQVSDFTEDSTPPTLLSFSLDMDTAQLNITFSEVVNGSSFIPTSIIFMRLPTYMYQLTDGFFNTTDGTVVVMYLEDLDLNLFKKNGLCRGDLLTDCDIQLLYGAILDMNGNPINTTSFTSISPQPPYPIQDSTNPLLVLFSLDMNSGVLSLTFSEVLKTFDPTELTIAASATETSLSQPNINSADIDRFNGTRRFLHISGSLYPPNGTNFIPGYPPTISFRILPDQLNILKSMESVATSPFDTFLYITENAATDYRDNKVIPLSYGTALQVLPYTRDVIGPRLLSFSLDVNYGKLALKFSETVDAITLSADAVTLLGNTNLLGHNITLSGGTTDSYDNPDIVIDLLTDDLNEIKRLTRLATSVSNTFISITSDLIQDHESNNVIPVTLSSPLNASDVTSDVTRPNLSTWSLDMNSALIVLTFDETVLSSSFDANDILLHTNTSPSREHRISNWTLLSQDSIYVMFSFSKEDLDSLKLLEICTRVMAGNDCFMNFSSRLISDMANNIVVPQDSSKVLLYTPDTTAPELVQFTVNMSSGIIDFSFSEIVRVSTFSISALTLNSFSVQASSVDYPLPSGDLITTDNGLTIQFSLTKTDLDRIKLITNLYTSITNTYITATPSLLRDMANNSLQQISNYLTSSFTGDLIPPNLLAFSLDMSVTPGNLTLTFDEPMLASSLDFLSLTLQNDLYSTIQYSLTDGLLNFPNNDDVFSITLSLVDFTAIQAIESFADSINTTWLSFPASLITDMNSNPIVARRDQVNAIQASSYLSDATRPFFIEFTLLDLHDRILILSFSEPVNISSLIVQNIQLQLDMDRVSTQGEYFTLTDYLSVYYTTADKSSITISLVDSDYLALELSLIGETTSTTFVSLLDGTILDIQGNPLIGIPENMGYEASSVIIDTNAPSLLEYTLDLNTGSLHLVFSHAIRADTALPQFLQLQGSMDGTVGTYSLTDGTTSLQNGFNITVTLTQTDLNNIKSLTNIATSRNTTFLAMSADFLDHYYHTAILNDPRINVMAITESNALNAAAFIPDRISPQLIAFELDLNSNLLILTFDETIYAPSFYPTDVVLVGENRNISFALTNKKSLSNATYSSQDFSPLITIYLSVEDSNEIKRRTDIGTTRNNTLLYLKPNNILDMSMNQLTQFGINETLIASQLTADSTSPYIINFSIDLNNGLVILTFSETMNATSIDTARFVIRSDPFSTIGQVYLSTSRVFIPVNDYIVYVSISSQDLNAIKFDPMLGTSASDTFLFILSAAGYDMNNNELDVLFFAIQASFYQIDNSPPRFLNFTLDMNAGIILLTFDEVIDPNTFQHQLIILSSTPSSFYPMCPTHRLSESPAVRVIDATSVEFTLSKADVDAIKLIECLATEVNNTYLTIETDGVRDVSSVPNSITETTIKSSFVGSDTTPPIFVSFIVNLNESLFMLSFNEPVDSSTLDPTLFTLLQVPSLGFESYQLTMGTTDSSNGDLITLYISVFDLNEIKKLESLYVTRFTSYLIFAQDAMRDVSGNQIEATPVTSAIQAAEFISDQKRPRLISFDLDMDSGEMNLTFYETVDHTSLDTTALTLQSHFSSSSAGNSFTLLGSVSVPSEDSTVIVFQIDESDLNELKLRRIAISSNSTYLTITSSAIVDQFGNPVIALIDGITALRVDTYFADRTEPKLISFDLDLDGNGRLDFSFSETIQSSTLAVTEITLQNSLIRNLSYSDSYHTLSNLTTSPSPDGLILYLYFSVKDLDEIKRKYQLAISEDSTYISITSNTILDIFFNYNSPIISRVSTLTFDRTNPILDSFSLDLTAEEIVLSFSEVVDASSLSVQEITLYSSSTQTPTTSSYSLTTSSLLYGPGLSGYDSTRVVITLGSYDLNIIKNMTGLAINVNTTFIGLTSSAINDMSGNQVSPILPPNTLLKAKSFNEDTTDPELLQFTFDLNSGVIVLSFNEIMQADTLNETEIILISQPGYTYAYYRLTGHQYKTLSNEVELTVHLTKDDLDQIKALPQLATSDTTTYITFSSDLISDMNDNPIVGIPTVTAEITAMFYPDTTPPELISYTIDLTEELLVLLFSETVHTGTLDVTQFIFSSINTSTVVYSLTRGEFNSTYDTVVRIGLDTGDLNEIKKLTELLTSQSNSYLSFSRRLISDSSSNSVVAIPISGAQITAQFTADSVPPELYYFWLDMNFGLLSLVFSETINVTSLQINQLTLLDPTGSGENYNLTLSTVAISTDDPLLILQIGIMDLNALKKSTYLTHATFFTFLTISREFLRDMNGNKIVPLSQLEATNVTADITNPVLLNFTFNLNNGYLTLSFSETTIGGLIMPDMFIVQSQSNIINASYVRLSEDTPHSLHRDPVQVIMIRLEDLNEIKRLTSLATSLDDTYLSVGDQGILDYQGNNLTRVSPNDAKRVYSYTRDSTQPDLDNFRLDLDQDTLTLYFTETVNATSIQVDQITLQSDITANAIQNYTLVNSRVISEDYHFITIQLSFQDLNEIKVKRQLASFANGSNTFISFPPFLTDQQGNLIVSIPRSFAKRVQNITLDTTPPRLENFTLDMDSGLLSLTFSEAVDSTTLNPTSFLIQNSDASLTHQIISASVYPLDAYILYTWLSVPDLDELKRIRGLADSETDTFIVLTPDSVRDLNRNKLTFPVPIQAAQLLEDETSPVLISLSLNLTSSQLRLEFNETVEASSLDIQEIALQSNSSLPINQTDSPTYRRLVSVSSSQTDSTRLTIYLHRTDTDYLKLYPNFATNMANAYISFSNTTLVDMNGNPVVEILPSNAFQVTTFTADGVRPALLAYQLNLTSETIYLSFSEVVLTDTIDLLSLSISDWYNQSVTLTGGLFSTIRSDEVTILLNYIDLNQLKNISTLAISANASLLSFPSTFLYDTSSNPIYPVSLIPPDVYSPDSIQPRLLDFDFDLNRGLLVLVFNEFVNPKTLLIPNLLLQSNASLYSNTYYALTNSSITNSYNGDTVSVWISKDDLNEIKKLISLASSASNTFLSIAYGSILDLNNNPLELVSTMSALSVRSFTEDETAPILESFDLNLTSETLSFTFSETVNLSTFNITDILLHSSPSNSPVSYRLSLRSALSPGQMDSTVLSVKLSLPDLNEIKRLTGLAYSQNSTFLTLTRFAVIDMAGNALSAVAGQRVVDFIPDGINPELLSFDVNMNSGVLTLFFSETVNASTLQIQGLTLQNSENASQPTLSLTTESSSSLENSDVLTVSLSLRELNALKAAVYMYNFANDSFLLAAYSAVLDMNDNSLVPILNTNAKMASNFTQDQTRPEILNFTVNLDTGEIFFDFDETILISSIVRSRIRIMCSSNGSPVYNLTGGDITDLYVDYFILRLTKSDLDTIKLIELCWTDVNNTYLRLDASALTDTSPRANAILPVIIKSPFAPIELARPYLLSFSVNMTSGVLTLLFNEPIRPNSFMYNMFRLQNSQFNYTSSYTLTNGVTTLVNGLQAYVFIQFNDLNYIKARDTLFISRNTSYLYLGPNAVVDMAYNPSVYTDPPIHATQFYMDIIQPYLVSYSADLNSGLLNLTFSETVNVSSLNVNLIVLQEYPSVDPADEHSFHRLTLPTSAVSGTTAEDSRFATISLSIDDLNEIKRKEIGRNNRTLWLVIDENALFDMNRIPVLPLFNGSTARPVDQYTTDSTRPVLVTSYIDMNAGMITLSFSETVRLSTINVTQLTIQSSRANSTQSFTLTNYSITDDTDATMLNITISVDGLNRIKFLSELAIDIDSTYLSVTAFLITDMFGNRIESIPTNGAKQITGFTEDVTSPVIVYFDLDMNVGNLTIEFSETVNASSLDVTKIRLQNSFLPSDPGFISYSLTDYPPHPTGSRTFDIDGTTIIVSIGSQDLNQIKKIRSLATGTSNTYFSYPSELILDMNDNLAYAKTLPVRFFSEDKTSPELRSYGLDLNLGLLNMTFSETVKVNDTLDLTQIRIQSTRAGMGNPLTYQRLDGVFRIEQNSTSLQLNHTEYIHYPFPQESLSGFGPLQSYSVSEDGTVVSVYLGFIDLNAVKYKSILATQRNGTYLAMTNLTILDLNDNNVISILSSDAKLASYFIPDATSPTLLRYDLNLDLDLLSLTFDEFVQSSSLNVQYLAIQSATLSDPAYHSSPRALTPGTEQSYTVNDNGHVIVIQLGPEDRNEIKRRQGLAVNDSTTYLVAGTPAVLDMNGNNLTEIRDGSALPVTVFSPDATIPKLTNFSIDMNFGRFVLTFTETIRASTLKIKSISLQDYNIAISSHTLTGGTSSLSDGTEIEVTFSIDDLNELKRLIICRLATQCHITYEMDTIRDMNNNSVDARPESQAFAVSQFKPDITMPRLVMFTVNMTEEVIVMTFSETVNATSLNYTAFTLQDFFDPSTSYTLTDGINRQREYSTVVVLSFSLDDLNLIKNNTELFTSRPNGWLTITMFAIKDMAFDANYVMPIRSSINFGDGLVAEIFTPDMKRPELSYFDLDMNNHMLHLFFTETMYASSLYFNLLTLQNKKMQNITEFHYLSLRNTLLTPNSPDLTIQLDQYDTDIIKAFTKLATNNNNTFLSLTEDAIDDMNDNKILEIPFNNAIKVRFFLPDMVHPTLQSFNLDMNTATLYLTFSEAVNAASLNVSDIRLQGSANAMSEYHTLTPGQLPNYTLTNSINIAVLTVQIGTLDMNAIRKQYHLCVSSSTTYLSLTTRAVVDMIGNRVEEISTNNAKRVTLFTPDSIKPKLVSYDINLNSELLLLTFDEIVNVASFDVTQVNVQSNQYTNLISLVSYYRLSGGDYSYENSTVLILRFDLNDLNVLKRMTALMTGRSNTYLTFSHLLIADMNGNRIEEIVNGRGQQVRVFTRDNTSPQVRSFLIDMDGGLLSLTFRETVNGISLYVQSLTLQNAQNSSTGLFLTLSNSSVGVNLSIDTVVSVQISKADLDSIKSIDNFAINSNTTWLVWDHFLIRDMNDNPVVPRYNGGAFMVSIFLADVTSPFLIKFSLNFITEEFTFEFNEPIASSLVDISQITLQDGLTAQNSYTFTSGTWVSYNENKVLVVAVSPVDWSYVKRHQSLATSIYDTYITFTPLAFFDKATVPNTILPLVDTVNATQASSFVYYQGPVFISVRPTAGRAIGGTKLTIVGDNFGSIAGYPGARDLEVHLAGRLALNTTVSQNDTEAMTYTPAAAGNTVGTPITLRLTIDQSALQVNVTGAFTYLSPPVFFAIFPTVGTRYGRTLVTLYGENFGPSTASLEGPEVSVTFSGRECSNLIVIDNYTLTCVTPSLGPYSHDINITVDGVTTTVLSPFRSLSPPVVLSITPGTTYRTHYTQVNITGRNFGPTTESQTAPAPVVLFHQSEDNSTLSCFNVTVLVNDTLLTCVVPPGLGFSTISVSVDGSISPINLNVTFLHYDDAGSFSFSSEEFFVGELSVTGNVTVIRHDYRKYASPAYVTIQTYDYTAIDNAHYINMSTTYLMEYNVFSLRFGVTIIAQNYQPSRLRLGIEDDVSMYVRIDTVTPLFGTSEVARGETELTIKAICEVLGSFCVVDLTESGVEYLRMDEVT